jgi:glutamate racemase
VPLVEAGGLSGPDAEALVAEALAPLLGRRDENGEFVHPLPRSAKIDTLLLGCTHYPLLRPIMQAVVGEGVAIVDSATATAGALAELLSVNGLEAPGSTRGTAADAGREGHHPATVRAMPPVHRVMTTGDVAAFERIALRMFGDAFPTVEAIELEPVAR